MEFFLTIFPMIILGIFLTLEIIDLYKPGFFNRHEFWTFIISITVVVCTILSFIVDYKESNWHNFYWQNLINWVLKPIFSYFTFVLINLNFIMYRNNKKIKLIEKELQNSLSIKNETFKNELKNQIKNDQSYYIYGDKGVSKTSSVINILNSKNEKFFYLDCTYDKFMELIFVNNNYIYKLIFYTLKVVIKLIYKRIIIDDIHLSSKENILEISEWLETYKNKIIIISPQNFRYIDIYNYGKDYETISNVMDKLYSRHNLKEIILNCDVFKKSKVLNNFMIEHFKWKNENKRVEQALYEIRSENIYFDFYQKISLLVECMMSETQKDIYNYINKALNEINADIKKYIDLKNSYNLGYEDIILKDTSEFQKTYIEVPLGGRKYGYEVSLIIFFILYRDEVNEMIKNNVQNEKIIQNYLINEYNNFLVIMNRTTDVESTIIQAGDQTVKIFTNFNDYIKGGNIYGK